jgi:hypothetical protein
LHRSARGAAAALAGALLLVLAVAAPRAAADEVDIIVLKEHGVGSATLAQPYLERFMALAAQQNGWAAAKGQYLTNRAAGVSFIKAHAPHYGILSLGAFLALRGPYHLEVVGRVASALVGGEQYFVVSKTAQDLAGCNGRTLASDHADDVRFVERVVARGAFKLGEFKLVPNQRPLQSIKQLLGGEVECALIDDAQLAELQHLQGGADVRVVWKSAKLPQMVVVAFPSAPAGERKTFQANLRHVCDGDDGEAACAEVGIRALDAAGAADYADVVSAYGG